MKYVLPKAALAAGLLLSGSLSGHAETVAEAGFGFTYRTAVNDTQGPGPDERFDGAVTSVDNDVSAPDGFGGTNTAAVRGNLATGELGLTTSSVTMDNAAANIEMYETLTFDLTNGTLGANTDVTFRATVDGTFEDGGANPNFLTNIGSAAQTAGGFVLTDSLRARVGYRSSNLDAITVNSVETAPIFSTFSNLGDWTTFGRSVFEGTLTLFGGLVNTVDIQMSLQGDTVTSFGNTAALDLFTDLEYTSASGTFLSGEPPVIPLPAGWVLALTAYVGLGALRRSRRSA